MPSSVIDVPAIPGVSKKNMWKGMLGFDRPTWIRSLNKKTTFFFTVFIWLRATLPRLRYDQLMSLGWKTLLPVAVVNFCLVGVWLIVEDVKQSALTGLASYAIALVLIAAVWLGIKRRMPQSTERRAVVMVDPKRAS